MSIAWSEITNSSAELRPWPMWERHTILKGKKAEANHERS